MIEIATVAFREPWLIAEQIRLFDKFLEDEYRLTVYDNTPEIHLKTEIRHVCHETGTRYVAVPSKDHEHPEALNFAAKDMLGREAPYIGFVDHDVFPTKPVSLLPMIEKVGFLGIGQRHGPTQGLYLWPGWCFFSRSWLAERPLNFDGIRGEEKRDDGDCGSMNVGLFSEEDWENLILLGLRHGYEAVRPQDSAGSQSWAVEWINGEWLHLTNASHWLEIPAPHQRDAIVRAKVAAL